jgi:hypothetical protein
MGLARLVQDEQISVDAQEEGTLAVERRSCWVIPVPV